MPLIDLEELCSHTVTANNPTYRQNLFSNTHNSLSMLLKN